MKATLEFDLPDDSHAFKIANMGADLWGFLWGLDQDLRSKLKHGEFCDESREIMDNIRDEILELHLNDVR